MKVAALALTSAVLLAGSADAFESLGYEPKPASSYSEKLLGKVYASYDSRYAYKDVVASTQLNRSGVFSFGAAGELNLAQAWKQELGAEYQAFCDGRLSDRNALNADWKAKRELFPNLCFRGGYELNYGGLPGYLSKVTGKAPHSLAQSLTAGLFYDDPGHGYFGSLEVQYGFYGMIGWRFDLNAGKRWSSALHERIDVELSAGTAYSSSFWGAGIAGFDQVNVKAAAPIRVTGIDSGKGLRLVPFIQLDWAGNTRSDIRRYVGFNAVDAFHIRAGVEVQYRF